MKIDAIPPYKGLDIPDHTNCKNCGACCEGNFSVSATETARVVDHILTVDDDEFNYIIGVM